MAYRAHRDLYYGQHEYFFVLGHDYNWESFVATARKPRRSSIWEQVFPEGQLIRRGLLPMARLDYGRELARESRIILQPSPDWSAHSGLVSWTRVSSQPPSAGSMSSVTRSTSSE